MVWFSLALCLVAAGIDLRRRRIPDAIPLALALSGVVAAVFAPDEMPWSWRALGCAVPLVVGTLLFAAGLLGGGDVKLLAGLGAAIGLPALLVTLLPVSLIGGLWAWWGRRRGEREVAYAPAVALGLALFIATGGA